MSGLNNENSKIFLSSTFREFVDLRSNVLKIFQEVNQQTEAMEYFDATSEDSLDVCLQKLEECTIYLGILGLSYGTLDDKTEKSYTHLEYEKAIDLYDQKIINQIWILLPTSEYAPTSQYIENDPEKLAKLNEFKETVQQHTPRYYKSFDDIGTQILLQMFSLISKEKPLDAARDEIEEFEGEFDSEYPLEIPGLKQFKASYTLKKMDGEAYKEVFLAWKLAKEKENEGENENE